MKGPIESQEIVLSFASPVGYEIVSVLESVGRIAYENVVSNRNLPPNNNSAMDGYVIRWPDFESGVRVFEMKGVIKAGDDVSKIKIGKNECYKIMTGGFIPEGGDAVAEIEICNEDNGYVTIDGKMKYFNHIRNAGEDIKIGDTIDIKGREITPFILARLISAGVTFVKVARRIRVGVISTGGELIYPSDSSFGDKTVDSNGFFARSFLKKLGVEIEYLGIFRDDDDDLAEFLKNIDDKYDIFLSSAGISSGDYDVVGNVAEEIGVEWKIRGVKQKPGKPFSFGILKGIPFFALPGNPVSSAFCVFFYVEPFIKKMFGCSDFLPKFVEAELKGKMKKGNNRVHFNRVVLKYVEGKFVAYPFGAQDSHIIGSIMESNGFCMLPSDLIGEIGEGVKLKVFPYEYRSIF
ncbi:MAG: molybdopterin molybdotransferase MoeA [Calditerrivibrio sp.]|nr:molybdopterin molybdotransferase MoeA [Calditerrivibrio sp.]MCA1932525.1 molybdopterin molybdotransferase MoeA [Calditerrivibrio sp.]MCA1981059.1 molybdopterin molybdotransferase MoeA [Calditerrivibrio sp.]